MQVAYLSSTANIKLPFHIDSHGTKNMEVILHQKASDMELVQVQL